MNDRNSDAGPEENELLEAVGTSLEYQRKAHADCPTPDVLLASQAGVLDETTSSKVAAHLANCTFCRILLRSLSDFELATARPDEESRIRERVLQSTQPAPNDKPAVMRTRRRSWVFGLAFAAAACAVLVAVLARRFHSNRQPVPPVASLPQQPQRPQAPSVFVWEKLPVRLQASTVLVLRGGQQANRRTYAGQLTTALTSYQDDHYAEAEQQLATLAKAFPNGVESQLYLGICRLALEQNAEAIPPLVAAQKLGPGRFRQDATWFLALAYRRLQDSARSSAQLQKLCSGKSEYATRACTGIHELSVPSERQSSK